MRRLDSVRACILAVCAMSGPAIQAHGAEQKSTETTVEDPTDTAYYAKYDSMACGAAHVDIVTLCHGGGDGEVPFCFDQTIDIILPATHSSHAVHYSHSWRSGAPHAVVGLSCMVKGSFHFVAAESTNFGNCASCEWRDLYTLKGDYVGSDGDPGRDLPVNFHHLEPSILAQAKEQAKIDIDRNP